MIEDFTHFKQILKDKLKVSPDDKNILERLGEIYRVEGDYDNAKSVYMRLSRLNPDNAYFALLSQVLKGEEILYRDHFEVLSPTPFVIIDEFLSSSENDNLLKYTLDNQVNYNQAPLSSKDNNEKMDITLRDQYRLEPNDQMKEHLNGAVLSNLTGIVNRLGIEYAKVKRSNMEISITSHKQFGKVHNDMKTGDQYFNKIALVYYFHNEPKAFDGGDLLLYDTNCCSDEYNGVFTRVKHKNNRLVAYPSSFYHEITKVNSPSGLMKDSRMAVAFWILLE